MAAIDGLAGLSMATKSAIDGPAGPVVAGDHFRRDRPPNIWHLTNLTSVRATITELLVMSTPL